MLGDLVSIDPAVVAGGGAVGFVVGMTGMGGGALMTPMLIFFFGVNPLTAVSSDLVASLFMKPVGGLVHLRQGTVHRALVLYLCIGSVPAAFAGVVVLKALGSLGSGVNKVVTVSLGIALLLAVATTVAKGVHHLRLHGRAARDMTQAARSQCVTLRPGITIAIGVIGGLVVGMTSVGSGSLIIVALLVTYPQLTSRELVGTDLVQAIPLVASAALGHALLGSVQLGLTASLLIGAIPGTWLGAQLSSRAPQMIVRRVLAIVLLASGLRLLGVPTAITVAVLVSVAVVGPFAWMLVRRSLGLPLRWHTERHALRADAV